MLLEGAAAGVEAIAAKVEAAAVVLHEEAAAGVEGHQLAEAVFDIRAMLWLGSRISVEALLRSRSCAGALLMEAQGALLWRNSPGRAQPFPVLSKDSVSSGRRVALPCMLRPSPSSAASITGGD